MVTPQPATKTIYHNGYIADPRKARKPSVCEVCYKPIEVGSDYYAVVIGGGGLGSLKFPSRVHLDCINDFFAGQEGK